MNERFKLSDIDELIKRVRTEEVEIEISILIFVCRRAEKRVRRSLLF